MREPAAAVLFDLDGTLIATKRLYLECYRRALAPTLGRELTDAELLALKPRSAVRLLRSQTDADHAEGCLREFYRQYAGLHDRLFEGVYPGVPEALGALRREGLSIGIVTGKSRPAWEITSRRIELGSFDVVVLDDDVSESKPDPAGIRLALDRLGSRPDDALYVGDTMGDVRAAAAAGVYPVAALWSKAPADRPGFGDRARVEGAEPAETPERLVRLVRAWSQQRTRVRHAPTAD